MKVVIEPKLEIVKVNVNVHIMYYKVINIYNNYILNQYLAFLLAES